MRLQYISVSRGTWTVGEDEARNEDLADAFLASRGVDGQRRRKCGEHGGF